MAGPPAPTSGGTSLTVEAYNPLITAYFEHHTQKAQPSFDAGTLVPPRSKGQQALPQQSTFPGSILFTVPQPGGGSGRPHHPLGLI